MSRSVWKPGKAAVAVLVSALAWLGPKSARGEQASAAKVALVWKAPAQAGCATDAQIRGEVERLSEVELVERDQAFEIEALALAHEGSWVASVALRDAQGRILGGREVTGPYVSCRDLDVPVALVVATLLDGLREEPPPAPAPPAPSAPTAPAARRTLGVGAFLAGAFGLAPELTAGAGVAVELSLAWPLVFTGSAYLPGQELDAEQRGARVISVHAGSALCPRLWGRRHALRLCGNVQAGAVVAKSVGLSESTRAASPLLLLGLEPELVLSLTPRWALPIALGAFWLPFRPRFHWEIEGSGEASVETRAFALIARIGFIDFLR